MPGAGKIGCGIGRYPAYVVNATEEWHIKAALKFAAERNLRVVVKNTGHNFQGRYVDVDGGILSEKDKMLMVY